MDEMSPVLSNKSSGLEPVIANSRTKFTDVPTNELVKFLGDELEKYWEFRQKISLRASKRNSGRKDLDQLKVCLDIMDELEHRPLEEFLSMRTLLAHPHPGVRLRVAFKLEGVLLDESIRTYSELSQRPLDDRGIPDKFAAQANASLDRLKRED